MLKLFIAAVLAAGAALGQTTVSQVVVGPDNKPGNGTVSITSPYTCPINSSYMGQNTVTVPFINGQFSVSLLPNNSQECPSYSVAWVLCSQVSGASLSKPCPSGGARWSEVWTIPASNTALTVDAVKIRTAVSPVVLLNPSQLAQAGATTSQPLCWLGDHWGPGNCGGGGLAGNSTWAQIESGYIVGSSTWADIEAGVVGSGIVTWAQIEAGTASAGTIVGSAFWSQIESGR